LEKGPLGIGLDLFELNAKVVIRRLKDFPPDTPHPAKATNPPLQVLCIEPSSEAGRLCARPFFFFSPSHCARQANDVITAVNGKPYADFKDCVGKIRGSDSNLELRISRPAS
jgi:S1-C subfamily serine protease